MQLRPIYPFVFLFTLLATMANGQQPAAPAATASTFRIGYIRQDPEAVTTSGVYQRLREFLLDQPAIRTSLAAANIQKENLTLQTYETHQMLIEAMNAEQVDLAFCSALDYAYQRGSYEPVFQLRRLGDPHSSSGAGRVWHSGVIFVSDRSPLFSMDTTSALAALPQYVMQHEMAMIGTSSAAGYVYPYLALDRLTTTIPVINARSVFWDSSSEVIKAVVNGIHDIGACDSSAIDEVLAAHGLLKNKPALIKEILRTDPVPRDPILLHSRWLANQSFASAEAVGLGREITRALAAFFRTTPGLPSLERTTREPFIEVSENLDRFQTKRLQSDPDFNAP